MTWEVIAGRNEAPTLTRAAVPGGWLYRTSAWRRVYNERGPDYYVEESVSMVFVPAPQAHGRREVAGG